MSREIKFRAWSIEEKIMLDWNCICQTAFNCKCVADQHNAKYNFSPLMYNILTNCGDGDKYVVQQYTELQDENGKDIYEGDIITGRNRPIIVEYLAPEFCFKYKSEDEYFTHWLVGWGDLGKVKVLGNIYENPGLLK